MTSSQVIALLLGAIVLYGVYRWMKSLQAVPCPVCQEDTRLTEEHNDRFVYRCPCGNVLEVARKPPPSN